MIDSDIVIREPDMTEAFVYTETDRTKSKWVARAYQDFVKNTGRTRTTLRGLFYHALQMKNSDYPICGGFVGEIRITRPYHESDGEKLSKWANKSKTLGFIPGDVLLEGASGGQIFLPNNAPNRPYSQEVWVSKSSANPLLLPVCRKYGASLVSVCGRAIKEAVSGLFQRCSGPTIILALSDLSPEGAFFSSDLQEAILQARPAAGGPEIRLECIGLKPDQVRKLSLPMVNADKASKEDQSRYKRYLKPYSLNPAKMAEIDCLEVYYKDGLAGFLDECLCRYSDPV
ncbi:MAG: hypothetical protein PHQ34_05820 [Methanothrix sp.]|nr:hypothetical protein [Methanothrix sp.]